MPDCPTRRRGRNAVSFKVGTLRHCTLAVLSALFLPSQSILRSDAALQPLLRSTRKGTLFVNSFVPTLNPRHSLHREWQHVDKAPGHLLFAQKPNSLLHNGGGRWLRAENGLHHLMMTNKHDDSRNHGKSPFGAFQEQICSMVKAAYNFVVQALYGRSSSSTPMEEKDSRVLKEVEADLSKWLEKIQKVEEAGVTELRQTLDTIYEALNIGGTLLPMNSSATARLLSLDRSADPVTKELMALISDIKEQYDDRIMDITDKVKPLTQEEIDSGIEEVEEALGIRDIAQDISEKLQSGAIAGKVSETVRPFSDEEVSRALGWVEQGVQSRSRVGMLAAEEQLRAGVERARYAIWQRAKGRKLEEEAATVYMRDGAIWAAKAGGGPEARILEGVGSRMYVDDLDATSMFLGIKAEVARSQHRIALGTIPVGAGRWLACARQKLWWMSPDVGPREQQIPAETQFLLLDLGQGLYGVLLPLVGNSFRSAIWGEPDAGLTLSCESGDPDVKASVVTTSLFVAAGSDPYKLLQRAFEAVSDRTGTFRVRSEKALPPTLDVFGWCTWDAFYSQVNPEGVKNGLRQLAAGGTPSRFLILDDGWQSTDNDEEFRKDEDLDARSDLSAADLAGGGVIEAEDFASQLTSLRDLPSRVLAWWYTNVVERSSIDSLPVKIWRWLTFNVIKNDLMKYFAEATDWSKRLTSVLPNSKFVQLGTLVRELKSDYGLQYTYCWHALTGYWLGVDPYSPGMQRFGPVIQNPCIEPHFDYTPSILAVEPTMAWNPSSFIGMGMIPPQHIREFFGEMHATLREAGIDGVKCDAQASITMLGAGYGGGAKITRTYVHAMEQSVKENLNGNCINCMCHPTENIYSYRDTAVARASDDFYPRENASHTVHVVNVVYNTLFLGEVVHPDWDMFQSEHPAASLHAAARAVGGCAVYTSDRPEIHNFDLLRKLVFPDGTVLRAKLPGRPTRDCLFADVCKDGKTALKIWNRNSVGGVVGVFNLQGAYWDRSIRNFVTPDEPPPAVLARVKPSDVEGLLSDVDRFAVWCFEEQELHVIGGQETIDLKLSPQQSDVLTVSPLLTLPEVHDAAGLPATWAPVGLTQMLNGGGAVLDSYVDVCSKGVNKILDGIETLLELAQNGTSGRSASTWATDLDFAWLLSMEDETLNPGTMSAPGQRASALKKAAQKPLKKTSAKDAEEPLKVIMAVKGQGDFLAHASVPPLAIHARPLSSDLEGVQDSPVEWQFTHDPATGRLNFQLPAMAESDSGRWLLTLSWKRTAPETEA